MKYEGSGAFSDIEIKQAIKDGHIVCRPYNEAYVKGASIDVTLGQWFFLTEGASNHDYYNPFDEVDLKRYFGEPLRAIRHSDWCEKYGRRLFNGIPEDHPIIVIRPGERILAHTNEFIGINPPGTTSMQSRSSWGRNGISVCFDAGWGDPGYINRWTLEIYNLNQFKSIPLPVGERIAQLVFYHTGPVERSYGATGKYQSGQDLENLIKNWSPYQMLPQAYRDERQRPLPL
jgi:deoxycytidine triphosphate deaminase